MPKFFGLLLGAVVGIPIAVFLTVAVVFQILFASWAAGIVILLYIYNHCSKGRRSSADADPPRSAHPRDERIIEQRDKRAREYDERLKQKAR